MGWGTRYCSTQLNYKMPSTHSFVPVVFLLSFGLFRSRSITCERDARQLGSGGNRSSLPPLPTSGMGITSWVAIAV